MPKALIRGAAGLLLVYLTVVTTLLLLENQLLYRRHPRGALWLPTAAGLVGEEIWLQSANGDAIHAWWCPRQGSCDAVLFCHGNSGNLSHRRISPGGDVVNIAEVLDASVLIFDYPGYGRSSGRPSEAGCYAAADAAYEWLVKRVPPERIVILGQSLGGGVATDLARRRPHRSLALCKTFTSIPDVVVAKFPLVPARWLMQNHFDNLSKIRGCRGPTFIAHGECDDLIPPDQARRLYAAAAGPKQFFLMPGCGHHGGINRDFLARLKCFLSTETIRR